MKTRKFLPTGLDTLEARTLLNASPLASTPAAQVSLLQEQQPFVEQVIDQINQRFGQFATQYYQLQNDYFATVDGTGDAAAIDIATFRTRVGDLVGDLSQQIQGVLDAVPGGGGLLGGFIQLRLNSDLPGSLRQELTTLPEVGTGGLSKTGFGLTSQRLLSDALIETQNFTRLYDDSLYFATNAFFNGSLRFFNRNLFAADLPQVTPDTLSAADQVTDAINRHFSNFARDYRAALSTYLNSFDTGDFGQTGDIQAFRDAVGGAVRDLSTDVVNAINAVPGGAGPLTNLVRARLDSDLAGSLRDSLVNLPPIGTSGLDPAGFALSADTALRNVLLAVQNKIRLYDSSVNFVAQSFFDTFSGRFLRNNPATGGTGGTPTAQRVDGGTAGRVATRAFFPSLGGLQTGLNSVGGPGGANTNFFGFAPTTFDRNAGFGGLGNGFGFGLGNVGSPFLDRTTQFGNGFGFGVAGGLGPGGLGNGFNTVNPFLGTNPTIGGGLGTSFGVVGPSFSPGFSGGVPGSPISPGATPGFGFGVTPGFGGIFF